MRIGVLGFLGVSALFSRQGVGGAPPGGYTPPADGTPAHAPTSHPLRPSGADLRKHSKDDSLGRLG